MTITRALEGMPIRAYRRSSEVIGGRRRSSEVVGGHRRSSVAIIGTWPAKASWNSITSISLSLRPAMVST